jgi:hypothetical protein
MTEHPMQPPPEQIDDWIGEVLTPNKPGRNSVHRDHAYGCCIHVARQAYASGGMEMMHSICAWLDEPSQMASSLINPLLNQFAPKPPSLKQQALAELTAWTEMRNGPGESLLCDGLSVATIRRALEALPDD